MAKKITDKNEMLMLYKNGKIHKATYYRGLKRGYIVLDYHSPHEIGGDKDIWWVKDPETTRTIIEDLHKIAYNVVFSYSRIFDHALISDLAHDAYLYLAERKTPFNMSDPDILKRFFRIARTYMKSCLRYGPYKKYGYSDKYKNEISYSSYFEDKVEE